MTVKVIIPIDENHSPTMYGGSFRPGHHSAMAGDTTNVDSAVSVTRPAREMVHCREGVKQLIAPHAAHTRGYSGGGARIANLCTIKGLCRSGVQVHSGNPWQGNRSYLCLMHTECQPTSCVLEHDATRHDRAPAPMAGAL